MVTEIERKDTSGFERFQGILRNGGVLAERDDDYVIEKIDECRQCVHRVRIGGRSMPLCTLAVILWHVNDRWPRLRFDIEEYLATAFRVSLDPSFIHPEWGVVLGGVLIARYQQYLPPDNRDETLSQFRHYLQYLQRCPTPPVPVQRAAASLLSCWDAGFPEGLDPVIRACLESWPDASGLSSIPPEKLQEDIDRLAKDFPLLRRALTDRERQLYRLHWQRKGVWSVLEGVRLR